MKGTQSGKKKLHFGLICFISVLLAFSLVITLAPKLGIDSLPGWDDIYRLFSLSPGNPAKRPTLSFIDVGQGDCTLIRSGSHAALIDAGTNGDDGQALLDTLRESGVDRLDYVIATHPHADHIGGMDLVVKKLRVEHLYCPNFTPKITADRTTYEQLRDAAKEKQLRILDPRVGDTFPVGSFTLRVLAANSEAADENEFSAVIRAECGDYSFLITGDAGTPTENILLDSGQALAADVLKVGHHGSKTATSEAFLEAVHPAYAVISVGENSFGHPAPEVVDRLSKHEITCYRTDVNGTITFYPEKSGLTVQTEY